MFKQNKLLLLVELWWAQIHYLNEPCWTFRIRKNKNREQKSIFDWQLEKIMWVWWLASNYSTKGKIYPSQGIKFYERKFIKNWESKSVFGYNSSKEIPNFTNHDISESNMRCEIFIKELWHDISRKFELFK